MVYNHGVTIQENPTTIQQPLESQSGVQVVFGTAPVNLTTEDSIADVVNKPVLVRSFEEAKNKLGYSEDWDKFTLCQAMDASFRRIRVAPVVFVNVLDPDSHVQSVAAQAVTVENKEVVIEEEGILLDTLVVKSSDGQTTYVLDTDYVADFNDDGHVVITVLGDGSIGAATDLQVDYDQLDPSAVTNTDVIGGYDAGTNEYTGIEVVQQIYPQLGIVPSLLLAPGWSHIEEIGAVLIAKSSKINGSFNATNVLDVDGTTRDAAITAKENQTYNDKSSIVCWPKVKIGDRTYWYSAIVAAKTALTDAENDDVPYKSPSNKTIPITAAVNSAGTEVYLDQLQANELNAKGIVTAVNIAGWRVWGNNTAVYDDDVAEPFDPKDRFIPIRRMFDWWGNSFILNYFARVDEPANYRLIESIVDSENIRANGFQARGQIAGARIEFRQEDNPVEEILNGKIQFVQKVAFFSPAEEIVNVLEFDPTILQDVLFGGES